MATTTAATFDTAAKSAATASVQPLNFPPSCPQSAAGVDGPAVAVLCLFCSRSFQFPGEKDACLAHLYLEHHTIISDVAEVAILPEYLQFWRPKFEAAHFSPAEYCTTLLLHHQPDQTPSATPIEYFLLNDHLPLDRAQRLHLHQRRLRAVLDQHQLELTDLQYSRDCLFCREVCSPSRAAFVEHLFRKHYLHLGRPQNLVYIDQLIDAVRAKLDAFVCLFCAKTFKDRPTLKEHMRKKGHKRINPDNKEYDKFYMCNYTRELAAPGSTGADNLPAALEAKPKAAAKREELEEAAGNNDEEEGWSDWEEEEPEQGPGSMRCLYCSSTANKFTALAEHMLREHRVDLRAQLGSLRFHKKVKLVNYVRRRMHELVCVTCEERFARAEELSAHLEEAGHFGTGSAEQWDQPEFFFPLFEDDALLFCLEQEDGDGEESEDEREEGEEGEVVGRARTSSMRESPVDMDGVLIYAEEVQRVAVNADADELSRELMVKM